MKITFLIQVLLRLAPVTAILGGQIVPQGSKTYMTGIRITIDPTSSDDYNFCGGVLITPTHVLTTAACVSISFAKPNFVSVGAHYINGGEDGDELKVVSVVKHPKFDPTTLRNDFAVLKLVKPAKYKPVKLPASDGSDIRSGMWASAMGWGAINASIDAFGSEELLRVSLQVVTNDACRKALDSTAIDMSQVCAGGEKNKSPCKGDNGGPLIKENSNGDSDDVVIGLISGGNGCGIKGSPAIFSRVSSVLPWIQAVTK
ncbi:glucanase inhibitor protein 3 [Plasmopara halstedii]|uniref:Glucanase inhibitor protein 3 n=1 Tax=Plasmopara halstedii TaxID=4781 RepID=A0A0P1AEQ7_PLAHL|nr:glucanase inhibitor protein 3 [Plasmopara halstedii]CEG39160.1 glucanase inhibitor protein 3 [Plasmopara halstedii]|eukprot:XP_024575529.1 glucanase inhibitor protein 3 [Plasmopara halstedii]